MFFVTIFDILIIFELIIYILLNSKLNVFYTF